MKLNRKKVLVTGACGFIGSHLVEALLKQGCHVRAFVYYNAYNHWGWLDTLPKATLKNIEVIPGDIRDYETILRAVRNIDIVFHLAALIGIPYSYFATESYIETNISGSFHVLQAALTNNTERVLVTSTSEVYGTAQYIPIDEQHTKCAQSPYAATKISADAIAESFYRSFDLPITIVRPFNTYGPRQSARAIIPTIISQLLSGISEIHLGNLHPTRDLTYVEDTVQGFIKIAESEGTIGTDINIASQHEISIQDLSKKLLQFINPEAKIAPDASRIRPKKSEVERLFGSNKKLRSLTNWQPNWTIDQGLIETIKWFKSGTHIASYKPEIYNV